MNRLFNALSDVELRRHNIFLALDIGLIDAAKAEHLLRELAAEEEGLRLDVASVHSISRFCAARSKRMAANRN